MEQTEKDGLDATRGEPCARRTIFVCFRSAAHELWGEEGLRSLGAGMPEEVRRDTLDAVVSAKDWLPESYVMAWYEAAWSGPAGRQDQEYYKFLDRMMDHGFGRVRKLLLNLMAPPGVALQAAKLWRHDHTTGHLASASAEQEILLTLRDHVYTTTPLARRSIAEILRHAISLSRTSGVIATHALDEKGHLVIRAHWR